MLRRRHLLAAVPAAAAAMTLDRRAFAAPPPVKIGVLFPLTGQSAEAGQENKQAVEVGIDIVNNPPADLADLVPGGAKGGLPGLGGAKLSAIYVDHHGDPAVAQSLTQRLITNDHVAAVLGSYQSSTALTATAVAERYGVPFVVSDSVANNITERGFKYTFRVTPIGSNFGETYMRFIAAMQKAGHKIDTIALVNENTDYGSQVGDAVAAAAKAAGVKMAIRIPYNAHGTDVSAQVLQLKQAAPDLVIFISYASDAILFMKTMHTLNYKPQMIIGDSAGFTDPSFIPAVGTLAQGVLSRSAWDLGPPGSLSAKVNAVFKAKIGHGMDDASGRVMEALFVLADALNRAGSTNPEKLRAALAATDMPASKMIVGYRGVKFDASGQNTLGATYLIQLQGAGYRTVWPDAPGNAKLEWPMKGWM